MPADTTIVFDTDCVLCSGMVHFVLRHERAPTTRFVGAWSQTGLRLAAAHGLTRADLDETFLVVEHGCGFLKSDAAFVVARHLRAPWSWVGLFRVVPRHVRDAVYTLVARRRYRWFGRKDRCFVPTRDMQGRFISD